jgi:arabinose-5-phosphate isomerase
MKKSADIFDVLVSAVMTPTPHVTSADTLAAAAVYQIQTHGIMALPVLDDDRRLIGIVHLHDLMRAGAS